MDSAFRARWLASSEVMQEEKQNGFPFQIKLILDKLLFGPLVIQLVWYILKQLFTLVSVKVVDIYLHFGE